MSTEHDRAVLNSILNPSLPLGDAINFEPPSTDETDTSGEPDTEEVRGSRALELEALQAAESGDLSQALRLLTQAAELTPQRASPYNNRAQVYRLLKQNPEALLDADRAVELSGGAGPVARQALCQRAMLRQLQGQQEAALEDYRRAAQLGSQFAKTQLVALNPYAALCNRMLGEVMDKLRQGETDQPKM